MPNPRDARLRGHDDTNIRHPREGGDLAQGVLIKVIKDDKNHILEADCITRDGWFLTACTVEVFKNSANAA